MNHLFKQKALKDLIKYNQWLLAIGAILALSNLLLVFSVINHHERWVLIPADHPDKRIVISGEGYSEVYLKEWAYHVVQKLMTTAYDTVDAQVEALKIISSNSGDLNQFFTKHTNFVKGSNIHSVFFPKKYKVEGNTVLVSGLFRYWLGSSDKAISQEKTYRLIYKRGGNDLLLLKGVQEVQ